MHSGRHDPHRSNTANEMREKRSKHGGDYALGSHESHREKFSQRSCFEFGVALVGGVCVRGWAQLNTQKDASLVNLNGIVPVTNVTSPIASASAPSAGRSATSLSSLSPDAQGPISGVGKGRFRLLGSSQRSGFPWEKSAARAGGGVHQARGRGAQSQPALGAGDKGLWLR